MFQAEDVLSRFRHNELSLPLVELDHLVLVLDSMLNSLETTYAQCFRWQWEGNWRVRLFRLQSECPFVVH